jgi:hypothetical protein
VPATDLLVLELQRSRLSAVARGSSTKAQLTVQEALLIDCCSDPGVRECVLQRLDAGGSLCAHAAGVCREAGTLLALGGGGADAAGGDGGQSCSLLPVLTVGLEASDAGQHASVQLQPLQVLARPACAAALARVASLLPQADTLWARQQEELRLIGGASGELPPDHVAAWLPPLLAAASLSLTLQQVLVVLPTALDYACAAHAVLVLGGLRLQQLEGHCPPAAPGSPGGPASSAAGPGGQRAQPQPSSSYSLQLQPLQVMVADPAAGVQGAAALQLPALAGQVVLLAGQPSPTKPLVRLQLQLPLLDLALRASRLQLLQRVVDRAGEVAWGGPAGAAQAAAGEAAGATPSSPTASDVERWLEAQWMPSFPAAASASAPGTPIAALAAAADARARARSADAVPLSRVDSDGLLQSLAMRGEPRGPGPAPEGSRMAAAAPRRAPAAQRSGGGASSGGGSGGAGAPAALDAAAIVATLPASPHLLPLLSLFELSVSIGGLKLDYQRGECGLPEAADLAPLHWQFDAQALRVKHVLTTRGARTSASSQGFSAQDQLAASPPRPRWGRLFRQLRAAGVQLDWAAAGGGTGQQRVTAGLEGVMLLVRVPLCVLGCGLPRAACGLVVRRVGLGGGGCVAPG